MRIQVSSWCGFPVTWWNSSAPHAHSIRLYSDRTPPHRWRWTREAKRADLSVSLEPAWLFLLIQKILLQNTEKFHLLFPWIWQGGVEFGERQCPWSFTRKVASTIGGASKAQKTPDVWGVNAQRFSQSFRGIVFALVQHFLPLFLFYRWKLTVKYGIL